MSTIRRHLRGEVFLTSLPVAVVVSVILAMIVVCAGRGRPCQSASAYGKATAPTSDVPSERDAPEVRPAEPRKVNSLGMQFVLVSPGEFMMGSALSETFRGDDERRHMVKITRPFYLAVHEVTVGQFRKFVEATGYLTEAERLVQPGDAATAQTDPLGSRTWRDPGYAHDDDYPVTHVTWHDAQRFCTWLQSREGLVYRLPTEAEWEYACRAGTTTPYATGDSRESLRGSANIAAVPVEITGSAQWDDGFHFAAPVGRFAPNPWGLCDMHGNVWEWCSDWYDATYSGGTATDPEGPASGKDRVMRGGSYRLSHASTRSANRAFGPPHHFDATIGFRVALDCRGGVRVSRDGPRGRS
ncbi:MAG: formylglycine-generating enzyme family protein [Thermoguttaceae bacterium]|jgi:formylglycine-generating enzyme required for sulfatase activity|nr:formylglycine-generating enzyme family protein [Thermoguttaceae bacterium]